MGDVKFDNVPIKVGRSLSCICIFITLLLIIKGSVHLSISMGQGFKTPERQKSETVEIRTTVRALNYGGLYSA